MDTRFTIMLVNGYRGLTGKKQREVKNFSLFGLDVYTMGQLQKLCEVIDIGVVVKLMDIKNGDELRNTLVELLVFAFYIVKHGTSCLVSPAISTDDALTLLDFMSESEEDAEKRREEFKGGGKFRALVSDVQGMAISILVSRGCRQLTLEVKSAEDLRVKAEDKLAERNKEYNILKQEVQGLQHSVGEHAERVQDAYQENFELRERLARLEEKLDVYESTSNMSDAEYQEKVAEVTKKIDDVDLSQYKILVIGTEENSECYPFDYVDVMKNPKGVVRCSYVDYVFYDIRNGAHPGYYSVKSHCKKNNIPIFHINNRNKDAILREMKRCIGRKVGTL